MGLTLAKYYINTYSEPLKLISIPVYYEGSKYILHNRNKNQLTIPHPCEPELSILSRSNKPFIVLSYKDTVKLKVVQEGQMIHFIFIDLNQPYHEKERTLYGLNEYIEAIKISHCPSDNESNENA